MMKRTIIILVFLLVALVSEAQNAKIYGRLSNTSYVRKIELKINHFYINGTSVDYETKVKDDNTFEFNIDVDRPQLVRLVYARRILEVYVEPNDKIYIASDANRFPYDAAFGDKGGHNNACWSDFQEEYPRHKNMFEYTQYSSGFYWYNVPPKINEMMLRMSKLGFAESMDARRNNRMSFIKKFEKTNGNSLTATFKQFLTDEIFYEYAYYMYCFGDIFKNKKYVDSKFFTKVGDISFDREQLGNTYYREFSKAYINHQYMLINNNDVDGIINKQYVMADDYLNGKILAYFRSEIIAQALGAKKVDVILEKYNDYLEHNTHVEFNDKVTEAFRKAMKYHIGSPAPQFQLNDSEGKTITLASLKGKPVFLNFWASWCHSCLKKMDEMKALQSEMEAKGFVFVNVSFDRSKGAWKKMIAEKGYKGEHVFLADGVRSSLAKDYNVRALPQYYLLDKWGNFAPTPAKNDLKNMKDIMERLLR